MPLLEAREHYLRSRQYRPAVLSPQLVSPAKVQPLKHHNMIRRRHSRGTYWVKKTATLPHFHA